jgi:putative MATE family efflux protein
MDRIDELGTASVGRLLWRYSLPSIAMMLVSGLHNLVDRIFIGQSLGAAGMAAVTASFPLMIVGMALAVLFGIGSTSLISIRFGEGRRNEAGSYLSQAFGASLALGILMAAFGIFLPDPMLRLLGTPESVMDMARTYLQILSASFAFMLPQMAVGSSLRAQGRPRAAAAVTITGVLVNAALTPLFIFGLGWGIVGAALGTSIANAVGFCLTFAFIQDRRSLLRISLRGMRPEGSRFLEMAKIGAPIAAVELLSVAMLVVANLQMTRFGGEHALAAIGVVNTVAMLFHFPIMGIAQGAQAIWGYNWGAGLMGRVRAATRSAFLWTSALGLAFTAVILFLPRELTMLFNGSDEAMIALSSRGLSIYLSSFFLMGAVTVPAQLFQSIGKAGRVGILYLARQLLIVALMAVLPEFMGLDGVLWAGPISDAAGAVLGLAFMLGLMREMKKGARSSSLGAGEEPVRAPGTALAQAAAEIV